MKVVDFDAVEASYQEETLKLKKQVVTRRKRRTVEREESGMTSLKKLLRASRRQKEMPSRPHNEQLGTCQAKQGLLTNRKRRRGGRGGLAEGRPVWSAMR